MTQPNKAEEWEKKINMVHADILACLEIGTEEGEDTYKIAKRLLGTFEWSLNALLAEKEKEIKTEFLRKVLPGKCVAPHTKNVRCGWNDCIKEFLSNAKREGIEL